MKRANLRLKLSVLKSLSLFCPSKGRFDLPVLEFVCRGRHGSVARQTEGLERRGEAKRWRNEKKRKKLRGHHHT